MEGRIPAYAVGVARLGAVKEENLARVSPRILQFLLLLQELFPQGFVLDVADPKGGFWCASESFAEKCFCDIDVLSDGIGIVLNGLVGQTP